MSFFSYYYFIFIFSIILLYSVFNYTVNSNKMIFQGAWDFVLEYSKFTVNSNRRVAAAASDGVLEYSKFTVNSNTIYGTLQADLF